MKPRIWLATTLVLLAALGVAGFQAYWTYRTYQQATGRLRQDGQAALMAATQAAHETQQARVLAAYARWLQDTAHVRLSCQLNPLEHRTQFTVAGIPARRIDRTTLAFEDFQPQVSHLTPSLRAWFVHRFTYGTVRDELRRGYTMFHTQWLGHQLDSALRAGRTPPQEFRHLFATALQQRGLVGLPFRIQLADAAASDSLRPQPAPPGFTLALVPVRFAAYHRTGQVAQAWLPAGPGVVLRQLQGVLAASALLVGLVLGGAGYAVGTMQRQKKLAALKADFTHNMTHELKTPVASIQLAADSLRHYALDAATTTEYATLIGEQASRLGALIDNILRSVALEQAALPLVRQPVALPELARLAVAQQQPQFAQAGRQLRHEDPGQLATVLGDATHLHNVLATLLDNALKYGGPRACLRTEVQPGHVALHLSDDGPGIAPEYQARVFEQFFRVPTGNLHAVKGYGLGLHYARQVAQAHGGTLTLRSAPGRGTTFTLSLPLV